MTKKEAPASTAEMEKLEVKEDKKPKNWEHIPREMKEIVVKAMDIITRTRLKMCSKADKTLVESIPIDISVMKAYSHFEIRCNAAERSPDCKFVASDLHHRFFVLDDFKFSQNVDKVIIWRNNKKRVIKLKTEDEATKMLNGWYYGILNDKSVRIDQFYTEWVFKGNLISETRRIPIKSLEIKHNKADECTDWLKHIDPVIEKIVVGSRPPHHMETMGGVGVLPCILYAKDLDLFVTDINDEQVVNFEAKSIRIVKSNVTVVGIRNLIKKWIDKDYPIDSKFSINLKSNSTRNEITDEIINGIDCGIENETTTDAKILMGANKIIRITPFDTRKVNGVIEGRNLNTN